MATKLITRNTTFEGVKVDEETQKILVQWFFEEKALSNISIKKYCDRKKIHTSTFKDWMKKVKSLKENGINNFHKGRGRPRIFTPLATKKVADTLSKRVKAQKTPNRIEFRDICVSAIQEDLGRNGKAEVAKLPSASTIKRLQADIKAYRKVVQKKTPARVSAEADPRNTYSMFILMKAFAGNLKPSMIFNFDNTQYVIDKDADNTFICVKVENEEAITAVGTGKFGLAVKLFHLHNAAGHSADPVYIISHDSMKETDFEVRSITGLGNTSAVDAVGHVVFCRSRCGNNAFYTWFIEKLLVPFVKKCREVKKAKVRFKNVFTFVIY